MKLCLAIVNDNNSVLGDVDLVKITGPAAYRIYSAKINGNGFHSVLQEYISHLCRPAAALEEHRLLQIYEEHVGDYDLKWYIGE